MPIDESVHDEFALRFYRWSLADAQRELEQGFPMLSTVKDPSALATLKYLKDLSPDECRSFMAAAVKRSNSRALGLLGESLTRREQELLSDYDNNIMSLFGRFLDKLFTERYLAPDRKPKASKRRLASLVKEKLKPSCGKLISQDSKYLWDHLVVCEGWEIYTSIDMGGNSDLRYSHSIAKSGERTFLKEMISLHTWLGFTSTEWSGLHESDETVTANSIERFCRHFLEAAPGLLRGISPLS